MASPLRGSIAKAVGKALKGVFFPINYSSSATVPLRWGASYAAGVSAVTLTNCPAGWAGVQPGDSFVMGANTFSITNTVAPIGGTLSGVTFSPALAGPVASGATISIITPRVYVVRGIDRQVNVSFVTNTLIQSNDYLFTLLADGLPFTPKLADRIQTRAGRWTTILSIAYDAAGATWTLQGR